MAYSAKRLKLRLGTCLPALPPPPLLLRRAISKKDLLYMIMVQKRATTQLTCSSTSSAVGFSLALAYWLKAKPGTDHPLTPCHIWRHNLRCFNVPVPINYNLYLGVSMFFVLFFWGGEERGCFHNFHIKTSLGRPRSYNNEISYLWIRIK